MELTLDGGVLAYDYDKQPGAQPPVLFMHGALGVRGQFDALRKVFPERSQIALDFPAHGESTVTGDGACHSERLATDVLALLDALDIDQVDIIGHSMGGYVGMVMAHLAPARVKRIVTLGTKFYWREQVIGQTARELDPDTLRARSQRHFDSLAALHAASGAERTLRFAQALIADFAPWQLSAEMVRAAGVPLLISAGDRDSMVPASEVMQLFGALDAKCAAAAIIPNTPHPLQHLAVACFEQAVRRFWETTPGKSAA